MDDDILVREYLAGDRVAGSRLYELHSRQVKAYIIRCGFPSANADDLVQEIFMNVFKSMRTFDPDKGTFSTWLRTIARNRVREEWRRVKRPENFDPRMAEEVFEAGNTDDPVLREELNRLNDCMSKLPPDHKMMVRLRFYNSLTTRGISEGAKVPESTVRLRIKEAISLLTDCMENKS